MKRRITIPTAIAMMLLAAVVTFTITYNEVRNDVNRQLAEDAQREQEVSKFLEVKGYIEDYFVGEYDEDTMLDMAMTGLVAGIGDQWSYYLTKDEYEQYMQMSENEYVGIGVTATYDDELGVIRVTQVMQGSPAEQAGVRTLEMIVSVDGEPVSALGFEVAVAHIKGEENTPVTLEIADVSGEIRTVEIVRMKVKQQVITYRMLDGAIGYVRIDNFDAGVSKDFEDAVSALISDGAEGLVFDVRINPGGRLQELIPMLDMLLPEGRIFSSTDKNGVEENYDSDKNEVSLPMAVLINQYSYSAAEFFAAALQEYEKAEIVGQSTTGKGYAQVPIELKDGSAIVLSVTKYLTPKGVSLADQGGMHPDYEVLMTDEQYQNFPAIAYEDDPQLQKAVEVVTRRIEQLNAEQTQD